MVLLQPQCHPSPRYAPTHPLRLRLRLRLRLPFLPPLKSSYSVRAGPSSCSSVGPRSMISSAAAVAAVIRAASASPVELVQQVERRNGSETLLLPSPDFQTLCLQQLELFLSIVHPNALLSVYVRPAGSNLMDRMELRRIAVHPLLNPSQLDEIVLLVADFCIPTGLRATETLLSTQQVKFLPHHHAFVFPMIKHPFVVGFLVAEIPMHMKSCSDSAKNEEVNFSISPLADELSNFPSYSKRKAWVLAVDKNVKNEWSHLTVDQEKGATKISVSLAMAYVMDQKATWLQQLSWQNYIRISNLIEQVRAPLSTIRTLSRVFSNQVDSKEISYDIIQDILVQGDQMGNVVQQLQDAVYLTKANIVRYNEAMLEKMKGTKLSNTGVTAKTYDSSGVERKDIELPMPPLALRALRHYDVRPSNASFILEDLVVAAQPFAEVQQRSLQLTELSEALEVAVEESALRQALSNLIEGALLRTRVGGSVEVFSSGAPEGGVLILIDDDGPDLHYMTQMHSLTTFGSNLLSDDMVEDNVTWNFVAGLAVAREILESYGCVVRVIPPRSPEAALGAGGTRIELWLPQMPMNEYSFATHSS